MLIYEMTIQIRVADFTAAQHWYSTLLRRDPDDSPHEGILEWQLLAGCWLQVVAGVPAMGSGPLRLGVMDLEAERNHLMQQLNVDHFEIHQREEVPVKWATFSDPWGNQIGMFEYINSTEKYLRIKKIVGE